jgi:hypothetical protein
MQAPLARRAPSPRVAGVPVLSVPPQARVLTQVFPGLEPCAESLELGRPVLEDEVAVQYPLGGYHALPSPPARVFQDVVSRIAAIVGIVWHQRT